MALSALAAGWTTGVAVVCAPVAAVVGPAAAAVVGTAAGVVESCPSVPVANKSPQITAVQYIFVSESSKRRKFFFKLTSPVLSKQTAKW